MKWLINIINKNSLKNKNLNNNQVKKKNKKR